MEGIRAFLNGWLGSTAASASEVDLDAVILAMAGELGGYDDGKRHSPDGAWDDAASNQVYQKMQDG